MHSPRETYPLSDAATHTTVKQMKTDDSYCERLREREKEQHTNNTPLGFSTKSRVQQYFAQIYNKTKESSLYGTAAAVTALKQSMYDRRRMDTMDESSEVKPVLIRVVSSDGLGGLKKVFDLGLIKVWIALVDELIEKLDAFPYAHLPLLQLPILFLLPLGLCAPINHINVRINFKCFDKDES
ncbi:hypothetical protein BHE74_00024146 [Ensete ventricosum]|nr:hypothetical protein GW17_00035403 [Ensete ventricosum]RWW68388.1 hypothetical protein BHE74_00024146 [Ensete ventricosum]RZR98198.1 hypothetical protein BHM03_00027513 [Ensete ventricosum]